MDKNEQSYYIDASAIIAYFGESEDLHREFVEEIGKLKTRKKNNPQIKIKIPTIAIGEILKKFLEDKELLGKIDRLKDLFDELEVDYPSPKKEDYEKVLELMENDEYLIEEPHDALFVAQMLRDETAKWVYTTDRLIASYASSTGIKVYPQKKKRK